MLKPAFHKIILTILFALVLIVLSGCTDKKKNGFERKMPGGPVPEKLFVLEVNDNLGFADKNMLSCFQGLINRTNTRIYYNGSEDDQFWLDYYQKTFGIKNVSIKSIEELLKQFSGEIDGYIIYPPESPHLLNIATTIGALENLLPATLAQEELLQKVGLQKKKELQNRENY